MPVATPRSRPSSRLRARSAFESRCTQSALNALEAPIRILLNLAHHRLEWPLPRLQRRDDGIEFVVQVFEDAEGSELVNLSFFRGFRTSEEARVR